MTCPTLAGFEEAFDGSRVGRAVGRVKGTGRHQLNQVIHGNQWQPVLGATGHCRQFSLHQVADQALLAGLAAQRNANEWLADYGSPLRDQAMILALLEENDLAKGQREERLFTLSDQLAASPYLSTQERNSLFLAGRLGFTKPQANWQVSLTGSGGVRELNNQQSTLELDGKLLSSDLALTNQGEAPVYQQLTVSGYPHVPPAA